MSLKHWLQWTCHWIIMYLYGNRFGLMVLARAQSAPLNVCIFRRHSTSELLFAEGYCRQSVATLITHASLISVRTGHTASMAPVTISSWQLSQNESHIPSFGINSGWHLGCVFLGSWHLIQRIEIKVHTNYKVIKKLFKSKAIVQTRYVVQSDIWPLRQETMQRLEVIV